MFAAGGQQGEAGAAKVISIKFSSHPKVISEVALGGAADAVYSLRRHESGNILFAGTDSGVEVLFFDGASFSRLQSYQNLVSSPIVSMCVQGEELYCLSRDESRLLLLSYADPHVEPCTHLAVERAQQLMMSVKSKGVRKVGGEIVGVGKEGVEVVIGGRAARVREGKETPEEAAGGGRWEDARWDSLGNLVGVEKGTNMLKVVDRDGKVIARAEPDGPQKFEEGDAVKCRVHEANTFLWPSGDGRLAVVDVKRLEFDRVDDLGGFRGDNPLPQVCLSAGNGTQVLTVCRHSGSGRNYFKYWCKTEKQVVVTKGVDRLFPRRRMGFT